MSPLAGPLYVVTGVLVLAGAAKLRSPSVTATSLRTIGIPQPLVAARLMGVGEVVLGIAAVATGAPILWTLVAVVYAAFTIFVLWALQSDADIGSCGCFGQEDTPPTPGHAAFNAAAASIAGLAIADPVRLADVDLQTGQMLAFCLLVVSGTALSVLALTSLPRLLNLVAGGAPTTTATPAFRLHSQKDNS